MVTWHTIITRILPTERTSTNTTETKSFLESIKSLSAGITASIHTITEEIIEILLEE